MLPFWLSIGVLSLAQAAVVALPGTLSIPWAERRRSRLWAAVPPVSVIAFVFAARAAEEASAQSLTWLALVAVPILAALALGVVGRGARPWFALAVPLLFALAWADRRGLPGEGAALALSALSCVALGVVLAAVTPPRWLAAGIIAMACADTALVVSDLLRHPDEVLTAAHPAYGLPRLQAAVFGEAAMGYGDFFVAGLFGALLARGWPARHAVADSRRPRRTDAGDLIAGRAGARETAPASIGRRRAALLVAVVALLFDLLFFAVDELPATVPVALALILSALFRTRARPRGRTPRAHRPRLSNRPARMRPE